MKKWSGYEKGMNLGGWLSQCEHTKEHYETFIQKSDIARIARWGVDHVRVPVDYNLVEDTQGHYLEDGFSYIQRAIDWCGEYGLNMVLDLHKTAGYSFDAGEAEDGFFTSESYQERFYRLWEEMARRFHGYGDRVAFELLNEVTEQSYHQAWNRISDTCIRRIRNLAPETVILVGGYWNNSIAAVKDLSMPQDDRIVYNFHCYDPILFTHQGAYWTEGMPADFRISLDTPYARMQQKNRELFGDSFGYLPPVRDEEQRIDEAFFRELMKEVVAVAEERNVALYCGEYGVIDRASASDTLKWYQAIHTAFEEYGIGRAAWCYKSLYYGITDEHCEPVFQEILKNL